MKYDQADAIAGLISQAQTIVIVQADNPDADSLASSLALEQIFDQLGKTPYLYCAVEMPTYLRHLPGWDRVSAELPARFDVSVIVDTSTKTLLEKAQVNGDLQKMAKRPAIVLDHHQVPVTLDFAKVVCYQPVVATGELIYELCQQLNWPLNDTSRDMLAVSIMSDSLGLTTSETTARSIHIIAELVEAGVDLAKLDARRRDLMRKSPELLAYKGELLQRIEYSQDHRVAMVTIPWKEIEKYSPLYNPSMLVIDDMRMTEGTAVAIAFKVYPAGKITGKIRANFGSPVAATIAKALGGGGHAYASGFKITDGSSLTSVKQRVLHEAQRALDGLDHETT